MRTLLAILLVSVSTCAQTQTVAGKVQTVGGKVTVYGNLIQKSADPHGIFIVNVIGHSQSSEWTPYVLPLIGGCIGSNPCAPIGNAVKGASVFYAWSAVSPSGPPGVSGGCGQACTGGTPSVWSDTSQTNMAVDWDTCNGSGNCPTAPHKKVAWELGATNYADPGAGNVNTAVPAWYSAQVGLATIALTNQTTYGVINITTSSNIKFLVGTLVGTNPAHGCIPQSGDALFGQASDGVTQCAQILGETGSYTSLNGYYAICDSRTTGCSDPTLTSLSLYTTTTTALTDSSPTGTVSNPIMDVDNSALGTTADKCGQGGVPVFWGQNFQNAYHTYESHEFTTWANDSRVAYLRVGQGIGFENSPANGGNVSSDTGTNCRAVLHGAGYPDTEPSNCGSGGGCAFWETYLSNQFTWLKNNVMSGVTIPVEAALSYTLFATKDSGAPITEAVNAVAAGLTLNSNGMRLSNLGYTYPHAGYCDNDSCDAFTLHRGPNSFTWQMLGLSDPTGKVTLATCGSDSICKNAVNNGPITQLFGLLPALGVQRVEPYSRDVECTISGFNGNSFGVDSLVPNTYAACAAAGYLETLIALGKIIN
ncbi:MAG TPA: hypothetical protein VG206_02840 [Terriglobia bacterium]|nr:hypothetical protein [Terriglobia bacterium]